MRDCEALWSKESAGWKNWRGPGCKEMDMDTDNDNEIETG